MSRGRSWERGYRPDRYYGDTDQRSCPHGRAKCSCCSDPETVAYKRAKASPIYEDWDM